MSGRALSDMTISLVAPPRRQAHRAIVRIWPEVAVQRDRRAAEDIPKGPRKAKRREA